MNGLRTETSTFRDWRRKQAYRLLPLFPPLGRALMNLFGLTLRRRFTGDQTVHAMVAAGEPFVLAFFHGRQFLLVGALKGWPAVIMTSISYMGEIQSRILRSYGYTIIRGSRSRGGARVLAELVRLVRKGKIGAFAVDGPRGPNKVVKPGAVYAAKKIGVPVVPVTTSAWPSTIMGSAWDQYMLPLPFSRCVLHFGKPLQFDTDLADESIDRDCRKLRAVLEEMETQADIITGRARRPHRDV